MADACGPRATLRAAQVFASPCRSTSTKRNHGQRPDREPLRSSAAQVLTSVVVVVVVAVRVAAHSAGGVALTELAAALVVAVVAAELRAVEGGEEPAPAHLARDGGERILRGSRARGSALCGIVHTGTGAAVGVSDQPAPDPLDGDLVEVEQVAALVGAASVPDEGWMWRAGGRGR